MANEGYHEPINELSTATRDMHRAITSLMEELEAVDWYNQRVMKKRSMLQCFLNGFDVRTRRSTKN
jgi:hypothetical protein